MATVNVACLVAAPIASHVDGSAITYGTGMILSPLVAIDVSYERADNPDYGDGIIVDNDNGINGYNATAETNDLNADARAMALGWKPVGTTVTHYEVTDESPPYVGWGYMEGHIFKGQSYFDVRWFHKSQFSEDSVSARTKERQIDWQHPRTAISGMGVHLDNSGATKYFDWMRFSTYAEAEAWLYGRANIPSQATTT